MDWRIVVFTVVLSIVTGILFGLIPALVASRADLNAVIKDSSSRSGSGFRQNKTRSVLVLVEVSLAVVLLVGASLLIRTSLALSTVDPGYTTENVLVMRTSLTGPRYQTAAAVDETARLALERIRADSGRRRRVDDVLRAAARRLRLAVQHHRPHERRPVHGRRRYPHAVAGYFDTFEIPVIRGRAFNETDTASGPPVMIINQALAKQFWKDGGDPLADQITWAAARQHEGARGRARAPDHRHRRRRTRRQHRARSGADDVPAASRRCRTLLNALMQGIGPDGLGHSHERRAGNGARSRSKTSFARRRACP